MRRTITNTLSEAKGRFEAYVALLDFRYANLCVEADARALLSTIVRVDQNEFNIEKVAWINNPQKDQFAVYPKEQGIIQDIGKAVMEAHPEFSLDAKDWDTFPEEARVVGEEYKYLLFTMPEVNKDRRDLLLDGVKVLHEQWKVKNETVREESLVKLTDCMKGQDADTIDKVKDQLDDYYKTCRDRGEALTEQKKKEIEEGYERYQKRETQRDADQKARGESAGFSMKMGQEPEEDDF